MKQTHHPLTGAGVLSAVAASLCCISPVLALISGASGLASAFSWLEPARPYLIGLTVSVLGFAWYQQLKSRPAGEPTCACEADERKPFTQTRTFLGLITVFAALMLAFPAYAHLFYPAPSQPEALLVQPAAPQTTAFQIQGMTCQGCATHVEHAVNQLPGIIRVEASYEAASARVSFDPTRVELSQIEAAINGTGYSVVDKP